MSLQNESGEYPDKRKVRYAVVGAGWISQEDFMPGVEQTRFAKTDQFGAETLVSATAPGGS